MSNRRSPLLALAEEAAFRYHAEHSAVFGSVPVRVSALLKRLGIEVRVDHKLGDDAIVERFTGSSGRFVVRVRKDLSANRGRFVLAHELGHVFLLTEHPKLVERWNLRTRERFANAFARELLLPSHLRSSLRSQFRAVSTAIEFVRAADRWGIHPGSALRFVASHGDWTVDDQRVILAISHTPNRFTGREPRLRVVAAAFDRTRFFVATNQSFRRLCPDETWLSSLGPGGQVTHESLHIELPTRVERQNQKYKGVTYVCVGTAVSLSNHRGTNRPTYLVILEPGDPVPITS